MVEKKLFGNASLRFDLATNCMLDLSKLHNAILTTTMPAMKTTVDSPKAAGLSDKVKVLVGGAPVTAEYAQQIGADGYGDNAVAAVSLARKHIST